MVTERRPAATEATSPDHAPVTRQRVVTARRPATGPGTRTGPPGGRVHPVDCLDPPVTTRRVTPAERSQTVAPRRPRRRSPTSRRRHNGEP
ncbi:hypothetical protein CURTO8I2_250100 [Curtobacterium sp. 8I-2]|nr:hypothetical protein CURTO8I2_250100 [Curtobacterium sp. 8I-2]